MDKDFELEKSSHEGDDENVYWHDAFCQALQMELHEYKDDLIFEYQHQLSKEALKMDVLIIKKNSEKMISKNIGRIFRGHNIFEFKSEKDNLSVWDYNKVMGYAMIYSAFEKISIGDITVSYVVTPKPTKLLKYLETERGLNAQEVCKGIYNVDGELFPVQIIQSKRLSKKENVFLKNLRSELTQMDMVSIIEAYRRYGSPGRKNAYFDRVFGANETVFREVLAMDNAFEVILREYIKESGKEDELVKRAVEHGIEQGIEQGRALERDAIKRETALEMIRKGFKIEDVASILKMPVLWVQGVIKESTEGNI